MYTKLPDGTLYAESYIKAIDLVKLANQIYNDKMQWLHIAIRHSDDDQDGEIAISAVPSLESDNIKRYPPIDANSFVDFDQDFPD